MVYGQSTSWFHACGGIIVYIRDCFEFRLLPHGPSDLEFLAISVHNGNRRICICLLYRPPSSPVTFFDSLHSIFVDINLPLFSDILVFGDFNVDYTNARHPLHSKLGNLLDAFSFVQLVPNLPVLHPMEMAHSLTLFSPPLWVLFKTALSFPTRDIRSQGSSYNC